MPIMPRIKDSKATKIAYAILGKPANLEIKPSKKDKRLKRQLLFEETARVR